MLLRETPVIDAIHEKLKLYRKTIIAIKRTTDVIPLI